MPPRIPLWGEVGAALARLGVPLDLGFRDDIDPIDLELPLKGGQGRAPETIEAKRQAAALVRLLYDDVFAYPGDEALQQGASDAVTENVEPEAAAAEPAAPVEVQAFDRKTGKPIKVRVNMVPQAAARAG